MSRPSTPRDAAVAQSFDTALRLHREGQLQRAEFLYRDVLRQAPDHADALNMLEVIGCQTGNFAAGADLIRRALAIAPGNADFLNNLGMALLQGGDPAAARAEFERAVQARPRFAEDNVKVVVDYLKLERGYYRDYAIATSKDAIDA